MVTNFEYLKKWLLDMNVKKFNVWKLEKQGSSNRNNGYSYSRKEDTPIDDVSLSNLEEWCKNNTGYYVLQQAEGNNNNAEIEFALPFKNSAAQQPQLQQAAQPKAQTISGADDTYFSKREFDTMIENERLKMKIERLEDEVKSLKENSNASGEFFKTITPFVGPVINGFLSSRAAAAAPTQIGSIDAQQTDEDEDGEDFDISEADFKQLKEDLQNWAKKDPDYLLVIHKLSAFTDNPMYATAKGMLFNQI